MKSSAKTATIIAVSVGLFVVVGGVVFLVRVYQGYQNLTALDLRQIGLAYLMYADVHDIGPATGDELRPFLEDLKNKQQLINLVKSGQVVLVYQVRPADIKHDPGGYVLGYFKDVPASGGFVIKGNGEVVKMTAEEFKSAKLAKSAEKK
jgi:hypothetical protein